MGWFWATSSARNTLLVARSGEREVGNRSSLRGTETVVGKGSGQHPAATYRHAVDVEERAAHESRILNEGRGPDGGLLVPHPVGRIVFAIRRRDVCVELTRVPLTGAIDRMDSIEKGAIGAQKKASERRACSNATPYARGLEMTYGLGL